MPALILIIGTTGQRPQASRYLPAYAAEITAQLPSAATCGRLPAKITVLKKEQRIAGRAVDGSQASIVP